MALDVTVIAGAVRDRLSPLGAEITYAPEYDLCDLGRGPAVCVVPSGTEFSLAGRGIVEERATIDVGFVSKAKPAEAEELVKTVRETARGLLGMKAGEAVCVKVAHDPLYSAEHLRERGQFTSVVRLTFKWLERQSDGNELSR